MSRFEMIAFDADDTLWHNERLYVEAQTQFREIMSRYHDADWVNERLYQTESRNMEHFGYGIKAFALSMIETSIELTQGSITGGEIQKIVEIAKNMLSTEVQLLEGVSETIPQLAAKYPLMLITKGDLLDQERKISQSGLKQYFQKIEIVSEKSLTIYDQVLQRNLITHNRFIMVGNSLRSDVLPILELGGSAVYIPYETTWLHEVSDAPAENQRGFYSLEKFSQLPELIDRLENTQDDSF